jgi:hypothetical protein
MIGITLTTKKWFDLDEFSAEDARCVSGKMLAAMAYQAAAYIQASKLSGQNLAVKTGETRESMGAVPQGKKWGTPAYLVRPGVGIKGSLNYLAGIARGYRAKIAGEGWGEGVYYKKGPNPFIQEGFKEWKAGGRMRRIGEAVKAKYFAALANGAPKTETVTV